MLRIYTLIPKEITDHVTASLQMRKGPGDRKSNRKDKESERAQGSFI